SAPMTIRLGWKLLPGTTTSPSSGPKKVSAKRIRSCPGCAGCARRAPLEFISFSRAWNKGQPSASACRSILQRTPTTGSWRLSAAASPTTTSIKIHETRIIRLFEVLLHGGNSLGGWTARYIHQVVLESFQLSQKAYGPNQLRYELRKLKGHGLLQRDGSRYAYRLTTKGIQVALLFLFFHKCLCGPLANSRFHHL